MNIRLWALVTAMREASGLAAGDNTDKWKIPMYETAISQPRDVLTTPGYRFFASSETHSLSLSIYLSIYLSFSYARAKVNTTNLRGAMNLGVTPRMIRSRVATRWVTVRFRARYRGPRRFSGLEMAHSGPRRRDETLTWECFIVRKRLPPPIDNSILFSCVPCYSHLSLPLWSFCVCFFAVVDLSLRYHTSA